MATLASLNVMMGLNASRFYRGLEKTRKRVARFGRKMEATGKLLSTRFTAPIVAGAAPPRSSRWASTSP